MTSVSIFRDEVTHELTVLLHAFRACNDLKFAINLVVESLRVCDWSKQRVWPLARPITTVLTVRTVELEPIDGETGANRLWNRSQ